MKKRILAPVAIVSVALILSACTTNPYTGESQAGKSGYGAGIGAALGQELVCCHRLNMIVVKVH